MAKKIIMKKPNITIYYFTKKRWLIRANWPQRVINNCCYDLGSFNLVPNIDDRLKFKLIIK